MMMMLAAGEGCYEAPRAAALAGVPLSTVYDWSRKGVVTPSISPVREKLWSYADLIQLRMVSWLRHPKEADDGAKVRATPMSEVRTTLTFMEAHGLDLWSGELGTQTATGLSVDRTGKLWIELPTGEFVDTAGRQTLKLGADYLDLLKPYTVAGLVGPHLLRPRSHLRIVPLKVAGEPHVERSRITTRTIAALHERGFNADRIAAMYEIEHAAVEQAIDLEAQLSSAAGIAA
ncbi:uncharacterized protein DUF433 [Kribbella antiqua]|uniref:Uncharacterized protein DUF433 n=1 Tax=Kribbella antiqua TaxID=2512217 RepID=A0A4R2IQ68_9ACTN|nr:DUF433 domain-containing protein [Kribbella antiqua]TCO46179.1 uncharacterized protein DUF433 [Kribbella antiqua]